MKPSQDQERIFKGLQESTGHIMVDALAGSGKTKTIEMSLDFVEGSVLMLAFNKSIEKELSTRIKKSNVTIATTHSFMFKQLRQSVGRCKINQWKNYNVCNNLLTEDEAKKYSKFIDRAVSMLKANCLSICPDQSKVEELLDYFAMDVPDVKNPEWYQCLKRVYDASINITHEIDFDDMILLPVIRGLKMPHFDYVFVDESQDLNACQHEMLKMLAESGARIIAVGDVNQAIYGFRGACANSMENMAKDLNMVRYPLNTCYRCSESVITEAQRLVPEIKWKDGAIKGSVKHIGENQYIDLVGEGDFILCRVNAPLFKTCIELLKQSRPATIVGRDLQDSIKRFIGEIDCDGSTDDFAIELNRYYNNWAAVYERRKQKYKLADLQDKFEICEAMLDTSEAETVEKMLDWLSLMFENKSKAVILSSVHRSKGLESKNVFIIKPDLLPHPKAEKEWQEVQEKNLHYVAVTRAMENLYYVHEKVKSDEPDQFKKILIQEDKVRREINEEEGKQHFVATNIKEIAETDLAKQLDRLAESDEDYDPDEIEDLLNGMID